VRACHDACEANYDAPLFSAGANFQPRPRHTFKEDCILFRSIVAASVALTLAGCASITDGTSQTIIFRLDPLDARCSLAREGNELGSVNGRQNTISVSKGARDIIVQCKADGYAQKTHRLVSTTQASGVVGGFFLDLGITDMITGAMWKYPTEVSLILEKDGQTSVSATAVPAAGVLPGASAPTN
jgi:hypothetical protein